MRKSRWKAMLIVGVVLEYCSPIFLMIIALIFPTLPGEYALPLMYLFWGISSIIIILSVAQKRIEAGTAKSNHLLTSLMPAQICLTVSFILLPIALMVSEWEFEELGSLLSILCVGGILASIILAIIRGVKNRKEKKKLQASRRLVSVPVGSDVSYRLKEHCERCGAIADKGTFIKLNGHIFCVACSEIMRAAEGSEILKPKAKCCDCHREFEKTKMVFVDDKYLCENCFRARYAGPVHPDL